MRRTAPHRRELPTFAPATSQQLLRSSARANRVPPNIHRSPAWEGPLRTGRLLLAQAVKGAEAPDDVDRWDTDGLTVRHERLERVQRDAIVAVVERRDHHDAVGDVEIRV